MDIQLLNEIKCYWTSRVDGYSKVNEQELLSDQGSVWLKQITKHLPFRKTSKILDVGTGPGFFAIILAREGYDITAIDCTEDMLKKAQENAGSTAERIRFMMMDAQNLHFEDSTFDAVISRNLTWNLENPDAAYKEWIRVLKKDGILLNFDANWYRYLSDNQFKKLYETDRKNTVKNNVEDFYACTDIDAMEHIAKRVPLTNIVRPAWDSYTLKKYGITDVYIDKDIWKKVWCDLEKLNYYSTPMFLVKGRK
jgi:ubiquinone/menaquinone biosynthesis C-methylase UbiE